MSRSGQIFIIILLVAIPIITQAQEAAEPGALEAPTVYISGSGVDLDFIRREITFVNYVRDRKQAEVHVLSTSRRTASDGREYTLEFIGQDGFEGRRDTLIYVCAESDTQDDQRNKMVRHLKLGFVPYLLGSPVMEHLSVSYSQPSEPVASEDPWNNWWFSLSANGYINGDQGYRSVSSWGSLDAQRITEDLKFEFSVWGDYNESRYDYESYKALSISRGKGTNTEVIFSLSDHWSWGLLANLRSSEYSNLDYSASLLPGLEYNIFPYDESSRRRLSFAYQLAGKHNDYLEETIYGKTEEMLYYHRLRVKLSLIQPWGSVNTTITGSQYFHDLEKNWLGVNSNINVKLFQGFSVRLSGGYSLVHDQLALRKGEASDEEILLRRQELETSYSYWSSLGFSYSFGSSNNNIVNPRF